MAFQTRTPLALVPATRITASAINELSGIVKSPRDPDTYWVHNDSGDRSRIFAIRGDGSLIGEIDVRDAANTDWEDITTDGTRLYISDLGNNANKRRDLAVYVIPEPRPGREKKVTPLQKLPIAYPDQSAFPEKKNRHFDCEAIFIYQNKLHCLTKHRFPDGVFPEDSTTLYRLDTRFTDRPNVLTKIDQAKDLGGWVTAAAVSPDGRTLAVLCHALQAGVWLYNLVGAGEKLLSKPTHYVPLSGVRQCEALCFDDNQTLLLGNEQREIFRLPLARIPKLGTRGTR